MKESEESLKTTAGNMTTYCILLMGKGKARRGNEKIKPNVTIMCGKSDETSSKSSTPHQIKTIWSPEEKQALSLKHMLRKAENQYWSIFQDCWCIYNDSFLQKNDGNLSLKRKKKKTPSKNPKPKKQANM